jgi:predicted kinase
MKPDWRKIEATALSRFGDGLRQCQQSPKYHAEGDAYTHTMMVCDALKQLPEYQILNERQQHILYVAALLHDIGKIPTTVFVDGDWHTPHHAPTGSRMARELLWKEYGLCGKKELIEIREAICLLVRYHSVPPIVIERDSPQLQLHRIAANGLLTPDFSIKILCLLCKADVIGRKCTDQQELLDKIALCEELAREEGCYEACYPFPSSYTQRAYLAGRDVWKEQELYDNTWGEVILMSGLPGTGKDTWIKDNLNGIPVISLDDIRRANKIPATAEQGAVANLAREQAKDYLRRHQPFVWNATNITTQMRESLVSLFETYHAHVHIVYLETVWNTLLDRNHSRENIVPQAVIEKMLGKLVLPEACEAGKVEWFSTSY